MKNKQKPLSVVSAGIKLKLKYWLSLFPLKSSPTDHFCKRPSQPDTTSWKPVIFTHFLAAALLADMLVLLLLECGMAREGHICANTPKFLVGITQDSSWEIWHANWDPDHLLNAPGMTCCHQPWAYRHVIRLARVSHPPLVSQPCQTLQLSLAALHHDMQKAGLQEFTVTTESLSDLRHTYDWKG